MKITSQRVLYMDTDQMGVVNHAVALRWFEIARAEWLPTIAQYTRTRNITAKIMPAMKWIIRM